MVDAKVSEDEAKSWFKRNRSSFPGVFEDHRLAIVDALLIKKRDKAWKKFRVEKLRRYARGKIDLFEEILFKEDGE